MTKKVNNTENKVGSFDVVKKAIEKKYGDVLKRMSDKPLIIDTISTRSLGLDAALGRGGVALGRHYEFFGENSSGKCVTKDTYISNEYGLLTIEELFELKNTPAIAADKCEAIKCGLRNEYGKSENTSNFVWSGQKPVNHIKTSSGLEIKCTDKHKLRTISSSTGMVVWKASKDITRGDYLLLNTLPSTMDYKDFISLDEAMLLGLLLSESGTIKTNELSFSSGDESLLKLFDNLVYAVTGFKYIEFYLGITGKYRHVVLLKDFKVNNLFKGCVVEKDSLCRTLPIDVRRSSNKVISAFLSSYFNTDGKYSMSNEIVVFSSSKELLSQIQLLLLDRFGVKSSVFAFTEDTHSYGISIASEDTELLKANVYIDVLGGLSSSDNDIFNTRIKSFCWTIPYQSAPLKVLINDSVLSKKEYSMLNPLFTDSLKINKDDIKELLLVFKGTHCGDKAITILNHLEILKDLACTKVTSVSILDELPVFDVVMPKTHSFISNGLISHNTTLAMSIIAEAQSRGMTALFIDAEHSADRELFKSMGVDIEKLLVIDAYTGEKNLMVAETLIKDGGIDLLVVDSVTALIPEVMAENELDKDSMALLARLMSRALLRLVPLASQTNCCVIWVNQTRMKIGGYGLNETTTGGTSLPFYATGRIRISGVGAKANRIQDDKGNVIGHKTIFNIIKNKLSAPFKLSEANLIYGVGYDLEGEIISIATDLGILERGGSWYKYEGKSIGQGENGVRAFFLDNPKVAASIKEEVTVLLGMAPFYKAQHERDKQLKGSLTNE